MYIYIYIYMLNGLVFSINKNMNCIVLCKSKYFNYYELTFFAAV
jgi:hypothetical protein